MKLHYCSPFVSERSSVKCLALIAGDSFPPHPLPLLTNPPSHFYPTFLLTPGMLLHSLVRSPRRLEEKRNRLLRRLIKEKWHSLFDKFKAAKDHNNKTGRDRKTFEFYDDIDEFLSGSDKVNPKFVKETKVKPNVSRKNSNSENSDELAPGQKLTLGNYLQCNRRTIPGRKPKPIPAQGNSRFARCRHLTTTTRIPFDLSLLFKF